MGNQCMASTPLEHYQSYFENVKSSELKDFWTTVQVYKIKKVYDSSATPHPQYQKFTHLQPNRFMSLFPELENYPERQKMRIFELFNFDGSGRVDWNNFYTMISVCYFGSEEIIATLMFMIFDESLSKQLSMVEFQLMCEYNENHIVTKQENGDDMPIYDATEIINEVSQEYNAVKISTWLQIYKKYFDMEKFRRIFNIFIEEKLEKDLIRNFNEYNNLYVEDQCRYVSYLLDYKWFEAWKLYVKRYYGYTLTSANKKPMTFKSKKQLRSSNVNQKNVSKPLTLRQLKFDEIKTNENIDKEEEVHNQIKNFDFINSNIGEKPKQINNKVLEGDFEQVLKLDIIENRDYVFVSEKVWKILKRIYQAYPEFRRTGFDFIELYPKILRLLPFKDEKIVYGEQNVKEVSAYYEVKDVLEVIMSKAQIPKKKFFYKTVGMKKWEEMTDLEIALADLSPEITIYMCFVNADETPTFTKRFCRIAKDITEINVGDEVQYQHPVLAFKQKMIFIGKNVEGKYILHIPNESYIYNICVTECDLIKKAKYQPGDCGPLVQLNVRKKDQSGLVGITNSKGLGYVNAIIMHLYYNFNFKQQLLFMKFEGEEFSLLSTLAKVFKDLTARKQVNTKSIALVIEEVLPDFIQFSADMCNDFFHEMLKIISSESKNLSLKDVSDNYLIKTEKKIICEKCHNVTTEEDESYTLSIQIDSNKDKYYEIVYVPYCENMESREMKRYGFKLKSKSTLKQYKIAFETVAGLKEMGKTYLLMEVYSNNIVKNYSTAKNEATLDELLLRDTDTIYAYELKTDLSSFVAKHYARSMDFDADIKIDQFVDCKSPDRGWIFGKVCEKDFTPYGHRTIIRVVHKFSKGEQWQISYDVDEDSIANFPTKSYLNAEQYHLRLQQRFFNEASNDMEICNLPLVVVLTSWMRWKEFYYIVYLQMRRFINQEFFEDQFLKENEDNDFQMYSNKSVGRKKTQKIKLNKFKEFIYGPRFPYKLRFVDYSGRCAICFKFLKSHVFPGENETYCAGCDLSSSEPISWQLKVADVMVCVDWKKLDYFKKDVVKDHSSYANLLSEKKSDIETLDNCLASMVQGRNQILERICCNSPAPTRTLQNLRTVPQILTIYIQRIIEENGFIKILNKHVKFNDEICINGQHYSLIGVISIEGGSNKVNKYRKFVMISGEDWLEYDSNLVRCVKKNYVDRLCAVNLFYRKKDQPKQADQTEVKPQPTKQESMEVKGQQQIDQKNQKEPVQQLKAVKEEQDETSKQENGNENQGIGEEDEICYEEGMDFGEEGSEEQLLEIVEIVDLGKPGHGNHHGDDADNVQNENV